jgi:hypothetical protein
MYSSNFILKQNVLKVFRPKKTRIQLYNTLALPTSLHGSENWIIKARDATRIAASEMKYMRRTAGHTWTYLIQRLQTN